MKKKIIAFILAVSLLSLNVFAASAATCVSQHKNIKDMVSNVSNWTSEHYGVVGIDERTRVDVYGWCTVYYQGITHKIVCLDCGTVFSTYTDVLSTHSRNHPH